MIDDLLLGLGVVAIVEGLVLALAPGRLEEVLAMIREQPTDRLRNIGLAAVAVGVALVWVARG